MTNIVQDYLNGIDLTVDCLWFHPKKSFNYDCFDDEWVMNVYKEPDCPGDATDQDHYPFNQCI